MNHSQLKKTVKKQIDQTDWLDVGLHLVKNKKVQITAGVVAAGLLARMLFARTRKSPIERFIKDKFS